MTKRTLFVHIGTHKTGTTSLQVLMEHLGDQMADHICVPLRGRIPQALAGAGAGHHNIAFELTKDRRFNPAWGVLEELVEELDRSSAPRAIISSEAFQYLYAVPRGLEELATALNSSGYDIRIVVFLRSRAEYAESLYAELVKHGLRCGFSEFIRIVLSKGAFAFLDNERFPFEYSVLVDRFAGAFGSEHITVRPYHERRPSADLHDELLKIIFGPETIHVPKLPEIARLNASLSFSGVLTKLYENLPEKTRDLTPARIGESLPVGESDAFNGEFAPLDAADVESFHRRFLEDDDSLERRYGIRLLSPPRPPERYSASQKRVLSVVDESWASVSA